jgi:hypothetical protein
MEGVCARAVPPPGGASEGAAPPRARLDVPTSRVRLVRANAANKVVAVEG